MPLHVLAPQDCDFHDTLAFLAMLACGYRTVAGGCLCRRAQRLTLAIGYTPTAGGASGKWNWGSLEKVGAGYQRSDPSCSAALSLGPMLASGAAGRLCMRVLFTLLRANL